MKKLWLGSLLLCVACASAPPPAPKPAAQAQPEFVMADGAISARYFNYVTETGATPRACLTKEPDYRSTPIYFNLELGNGRNRFITLALDESGGPGKGYDTLYADANNHGDLTDYPPTALVAGEFSGPQFANLKTKEPIPLTIRYDDGTSRPMPTRISININHFSGQTNYSLDAEPTRHVEGKVMFGDKPVLVGIYLGAPREGWPDWCFDDYGVDRLRIDRKGQGKLTPDEEMPLSKVISYHGKLWELVVNSAATQVTVKPCALPSGPVQVEALFDGTPVGGQLEFADHAGTAFSELFAEDAPVLPAPAGKYHVTSGSVILADAEGARWRGDFSYPGLLEVVPGTGALLLLEKPLKVEPVVTTMMMSPDEAPGVYKLGGRVQVSYDLLGPGGEKYSAVSPEGQRKGQQVRILDSEGIEVASGAMEYG
jgi:hypothetical protein